jgi:hypothetical protein
VLPRRFDAFAPRLVYSTKLDRGGPGIPIRARWAGGLSCCVMDPVRAGWF